MNAEERLLREIFEASPTERLQAAIDKLERLRAESTQPTGGRTSWMQGDPYRSQFERANEVFTGPEERGVSEDIAIWLPEDADAELIVTLHRTIDAQLAILRGAIEEVRVAEGHGIPAEHVGVAALALADAILGGAS